MSKITTLVFLFVLILFATLTIAQAKTARGPHQPVPVYVEGPMELGQGMGNVSDGKDAVSFTFDRPFAAKLIRTCQDGDWCRVTGTADEHGNLLTVSSVAKIKRGK